MTPGFMNAVARWSFLGGGRGELLFVNVKVDTNTHMLIIVYVFIAVLPGTW